jgi:hypothetical protein
MLHLQKAHTWEMKGPLTITQGNFINAYGFTLPFELRYRVPEGVCFKISYPSK